MKTFCLFLALSLSVMAMGDIVNVPSQQNTNTIIIQPQNNGQYVPPYWAPYYYYPYQPDNGPMRGPNSIEGHQHAPYG